MKEVCNVKRATVVASAEVIRRVIGILREDREKMSKANSLTPHVASAINTEIDRLNTLDDALIAALQDTE